MTWGGGRGILVVEIEQQFQFLKRRFDPHGLAAPRQRPAFPARYGPPKSMLKLKMSNPRLKEPQAIVCLPKRGPRKAALRLCGERSRSEMSERRIKKPPQAIGSLRRRGGGGWIRTIEGKASRFTVCPLWPLGYSSLFSWAEEGWSWWTDSNPRPADYKSAALPAELHQHRSLPRYSGAYYNSRNRACQPFFKKNFKRAPPMISLQGPSQTTWHPAS